jgi:DNA-binding IscR family transcriptional regulator
LHEARAAFLAVLDGYSLADLVDNREVLRELFAQGPQSTFGANDAISQLQAVVKG